MPKFNNGKSSSIRYRVGLPQVSGRGLYIGSTILDSLAHGLVFAFLLVYFDRVTGLDLATVGISLSIGRLLAMPVPILIAPIMDSLGSKQVVVWSNVVACVGMAVCAFATTAWLIVIAQFLVQSATNMYWTCSRDLIQVASRGQDRPRWFGLQIAVRNLGAGLGAAASAGALAIFGKNGLQAVVAVSALAFLTAAALLIAWRTGQSTGDRDRNSKTEHATTYRAVLLDRRFRSLLLVNLVFVFAAMVLPVLIAIWTIDYVRAGSWWAGSLIVMNTVMVALLSTVFVGRLEKYRRSKIVRWALVANAGAFFMFAVSERADYLTGVSILVSAMILYTIGEIVGTPFINELTVSLSPSVGAGRYQAAFQMSWSLGMAVSPAIFTSLLAIDGGLPWVLLTAISLLAIPFTSAFDTDDEDGGSV